MLPTSFGWVFFSFETLDTCVAVDFGVLLSTRSSGNSGKSHKGASPLAGLYIAITSGFEGVPSPAHRTRNV